ncbi:hypothetical protein J6X09_02675, partial [Candidatus Saccharibacteria bacterium]|nr:hypothetical protein [Candidatus Saccharibacteria bacterium]
MDDPTLRQSTPSIADIVASRIPFARLLIVCPVSFQSNVSKNPLIESLINVPSDSQWKLITNELTVIVTVLSASAIVSPIVFPSSGVSKNPLSPVARDLPIFAPT